MFLVISLVVAIATFLGVVATRVSLYVLVYRLFKLDPDKAAPVVKSLASMSDPKAVGRLTRPPRAPG